MTLLTSRDVLRLALAAAAVSKCKNVQNCTKLNKKVTRTVEHDTINLVSHRLFRP